MDNFFLSRIIDQTNDLRIVYTPRDTVILIHGEERKEISIKHYDEFIEWLEIVCVREGRPHATLKDIVDYWDAIGK